MQIYSELAVQNRELFEAPPERIKTVVTIGGFLEKGKLFMPSLLKRSANHHGSSKAELCTWL